MNKFNNLIRELDYWIDLVEDKHIKARIDQIKKNIKDIQLEEQEYITRELIKGMGFGKGIPEDLTVDEYLVKTLEIAEPYLLLDEALLVGKHARFKFRELINSLRRYNSLEYLASLKYGNLYLTRLDSLLKEREEEHD